jgi:hypothetical protein
MPTTAITDACICLDIWHGRLLPHLYLPGLRWVIPDVVAATELKRPPREVFEQAGMAIASATGDEVSAVAKLKPAYQKLSTGDLFALVLAKRPHTILLSGDGDLRAAAVKEGVEVHGVLWLLDQLEAQHLPAVQLADALEAMLKNGARLPPEECASRLKRWRQLTAQELDVLLEALKKI